MFDSSDSRSLKTNNMKQLTINQLFEKAKELVIKYNETLNEAYSDQYNKVMLLINLRLANGQL